MSRAQSLALLIAEGYTPSQAQRAYAAGRRVSRNCLAQLERVTDLDARAQIIGVQTALLDAQLLAVLDEPAQGAERRAS